MERKQMQDLIQRLWDKGAGIEIIKILEHDKQQREALARVEAERDEALAEMATLTSNHLQMQLIVNTRANMAEIARAQLAEAVGLLRDAYLSVASSQRIYEFIQRHGRTSQQEDEKAL